MNITILDDYQRAIQNLACFSILAVQNIQILHLISAKRLKM